MSARARLIEARDLPSGSLIVERYVWTNPASKYAARSGVQWLAQEVDKEGNWALLKVCKSRVEALAVICGA